MAKYTLFPGKSVAYTSKKGVQYTIANIGGVLVCYVKGKKRKPTNEILSKFVVAGGKYTVYSDGGCSVNPGGRGGYGAIIIDDEGNITQLSEGFMASTNNRMELMGAIASLSLIPKGAKVDFYSDSKYVVDTMLHNYSRNKNVDLWSQLDNAVKGKKIKYMWVRGHNGDKFNEICDKLATAAMNKEELLQDAGYDGPIKKQSKSAMTIEIIADETIPTPGNVSDECAMAIKDFYSKPDHRFRDYAALKTGGMDYYSKLSKEKLLSICNAEIKTVETYLLYPDVIAALRWNCRGLSLKDSIRKVLVDKEVTQKCKR